MGSSEIKVSVLGFGCGGRAGLMVSDNMSLQVETVGRALERGITYFDTAPAYGWGKSETALGMCLAYYGRPAIISTKVVILREELRDIRGAILKSIDGSLERLRRNKVEMLLLHNRVGPSVQPDRIVGVGPILGWQELFGDNGVVETFRKLIEEGLIKACGFTTYGGDTTTIARVIDTKLFDFINASFSIVNPTAAYEIKSHSISQEQDYACVIQKARMAGLGVSCIRVLESGHLIGHAEPKDNIVDVTMLDNARTTAKRLGKGNIISGAIRFALNTPGVSTAIIGLSDPSQVEEAAESIEDSELDEGMYEEARSAIGIILRE